MKEMFEAIENMNFDKYYKKKEKMISKKIYKYIQFDKTVIDRNSKSLLESKLWCSNLDKLNDPYEGKLLYIDKKECEHDECIIEQLEKVLDYSKRYNSCSFTLSGYKNQLFWSYYTNNEGICIEFEVIKKDNLFPVSYEINRLKTNNVIGNLIYNDNLTDDEKKRNFLLLRLANTCKEKSWEMEREIRFLQYSDDINEDGKPNLMEDIGVKVTKIYLGINFNIDDNMVLLEKLSKKFESKVIKLTLDQYNSEFNFKEEELKF